METSPSIKEIAAALGAFQAKGTVVSKDGVNPHFKSKFATLPNVIETIREGLTPYKLSFSQFPDGDGLTTILMHETGEWIRATANLTIEKPTPQAHQSAITYMRRNALLAILGLPAEDDDGNEASRPAPKKELPSVSVKTDATEIKKLLKALGHEPKTVKEADLITRKLTELPYEPDMYADIIERLQQLQSENN